MLPQPAPQPKSATRAAGVARNRASSAGMRRQPLSTEQVHVDRAIAIGLALAGVVPELRPGDTSARAKGVDDTRQRVRSRKHEPRQRRHIAQAVTIEQHLGVPVRQREATFVSRGGRVDHIQHAIDGLLLEPFARIARIDASPLGKLGGCRRTQLLQVLIQVEPIAQVHGEQVGEAQNRRVEAPGELVAARLVVCVMRSVIEAVMAASMRGRAPVRIPTPSYRDQVSDSHPNSQP